MSNTRGMTKWIRPVAAVSVALLFAASTIFFVNQLLGPGTTGSNKPPVENHEYLPDLSLTSAGVSFSDDNPVEGSTVFISAIVHNIGGLSSDSTSVEFWDDVCEGCDGKYLIGIKQLTSMEPGSARVASIAWDTSGQGGDNVITVLVDSENNVLESGELNNAVTKSIHVEPMISEPPTVLIWEPNGGENWSGGSIHLIIWEWWDEATSIYANVSYSIDVGFTWEPIVEGYFSMMIEMYEWLVPEVNTTTALVKVCVTDQDNQMACDTSDDFFTIEGISLSIIYTSPENDEWNVALDAPLKVKFNRPVNRSSANFTLFPEIGGINFEWFENDTLIIASHDLFEEFTCYNWIIRACDAAKPEECTQKFVWFWTLDQDITNPDLTLTPDDVWFEPSDPTYGDFVTIRATIHNIGNQTSQFVHVDFTDNALCMTPTPYYLGSDIAFPIPPGGSESVSVQWNTTESADGCDIITVEIDPYNFESELNETNNEASKEIYVSETPCEKNPNGADLAFVNYDDITVSNMFPMVGENVTIKAKVHNIGGEDADNITVWFIDEYLPIDPIEPPRRELIGDVLLPLVPAKNYTIAIINWTARNFGDHIIEVIIDPLNEFVETAEGNNKMWAPPIFVFSPIGVDLAVWDIEFSNNSPNEGDVVIISTTVYNLGDEDAYNVTVMFEDCHEKSPCTLIDLVEIPYIPFWGFEDTSSEWNASGEGMHTIVVTADPFNEIDEFCEWNNQAQAMIIVGGPPVPSIFVQAATFDDDDDGKYDDVVIFVFDSDGHAVEGASVYIDGVLYGITLETGLLLDYDFSEGMHHVLVAFGTLSAETSFYSEG